MVAKVVVGGNDDCCRGDISIRPSSVVAAVTAKGDDEVPFKLSLVVLDNNFASNEVTPACDSSPNIVTPSVVKELVAVVLSV